MYICICLAVAILAQAAWAQAPPSQCYGLFLLTWSLGKGTVGGAVFSRSAASEPSQWHVLALLRMLVLDAIWEVLKSALTSASSPKT